MLAKLFIAASERSNCCERSFACPYFVDHSRDSRESDRMRGGLWVFTIQVCCTCFASDDPIPFVYREVHTQKRVLSK